MKTGPKPRPISDRLSKWEYGGINGDCWEWEGTINVKSGYGQLYHGGKTVYAHRLSFSYHYPDISIEGKIVRHKCDNRHYINPEHLITGSSKDNMADAIERGRLPRGGARWNSKLNERQVETIRNLLAIGELTQLQIANMFGISRGCVSKIKRGLSWKDHSQSQMNLPQNKTED